MGESFSELYPMIKPVTKQIYIADVTKVDNEYRGVLPGKGSVPLKEVFSSLVSKNFDCWVTFKWEKIWNSGLEEPEVALPYFKDYYNHFFINEE
jgi:sugar phosphate isomerase/epimerase